MIPVIFLFALLSTPTDKYICDLWTRALTQDDLAKACGVVPSSYRIDVYDLEMDLICSRPADTIYGIVDECALEDPLDYYILRIVEPGFSSLLCMVESEHEDAPTEEEIRSQCPWTRDYIVEFAGVKQPETPDPFTCPPRDLVIGFGLYTQAASVDALFTDDQFTWLAGMLIWYGIVAPDCYGSGLDMYTLAADPCGMAFARAEMIRWQNQFNEAIYNAAIAYSIPAHLLKRMIAVESQFWPYYQAPAGEIGIMQVTDNGLDTLLRFDPTLDLFYLGRNELEQSWSRNVTRNALVCVGCTLQEAIDHIKNTMTYYARLLAAFHCRAVTINPSLVGDSAWRQAVVDYNGSAVYLERIEQ